jgi:hypothetical protein
MSQPYAIRCIYRFESCRSPQINLSEMIMKYHEKHWHVTFALAFVLVFPGCGGSKVKEDAQSPKQQEIERLRAENQELPKLQADNKEVAKLQAENQNIHKLRGEYQELVRARKDNEQLRAQVAKLPTASAAGALRTAPQAAATPALGGPQPILNVVQAFDEAAFALEGQELKEPDKPIEGDRIMVDTNAIALLIPDLLTPNSSGSFEISGWLKSKGVRLKNYQQFNSLGITNYQIQRADPAPKNQVQ